MPHITFIHGIANKPAPDKLLKLWRDSLARDNGIDLGANGVTSSMVYWADLLYDKPQADEPGYESAELSESADLAIKSSDAKIEMGWRESLGGEEEAWVGTLAAKLNFEAEVDEKAAPAEEVAGPQFERIPLPGFLKKELMKTFLRDVHHYLFNVTYSPRPGESWKIQEEIRRRLLAALTEGAKQPGPHILVSHSMGTVIAYDCLKRVPDCPRVDGLMTIGSPLGLDEIQDALKPEYSSWNGFPMEKVAARWVNVYDRLDPVAGFDPVFGNDYRKDGQPAVEDINEQNWGRWRHDIAKYLKGAKLRAKLSEMLDL